MTNKEAINICKREQYCASHSECSHEKCPWNENCLDDAPFDSEIQEAFQMAIEALKQNQWISCSERLPETNSRVLITIWGRSCEAVYDKDGAWIMAVPFMESTIYKNQFRPEFITAWMPLPKPWKGEE